MANNNNGMITQNELSDSLNKKINDSDTNSKLNKQQIGTMNNLKTSKKDTLVNSINEVDDNSKLCKQNIGTMGNLKTSKKDTLVNSINELFQYASNGKTLVANAITGKGVQSNSNMTFQQLATNISNIKTGYNKEDIESNTGLIKLKVEKMIKKRSELPSITTDRFSQLSIMIKDDLICMTYITAYSSSSSEYNFYFDQDLNLIKRVKRTDDNVNWGDPHDRLHVIGVIGSVSMGNGITLNVNPLYRGTNYNSDYVDICYFTQNDGIIIFADIIVYSSLEEGLSCCGVFCYKGYGYMVSDNKITRYKIYHTT